MGISQGIVVAGTIGLRAEPAGDVKDSHDHLYFVAADLRSVFG
jgi:hypothetical protein